MPEFVRLKAIAGAAAPCGPVVDYDDDYLLLDPEALADDFPDDAYFEVNAGTLKSIGRAAGVFGDLLPNGESVLLCSKRLVEKLVPHVGEHEVLPVTVKLKKQEKAYFILRPLDRVAIIDLAASGVEPDEDGLVDGLLADLTLDTSAVPETIKLFVPCHRNGEYLCERQFAEALATEFDGVLLKEVTDRTS